MTKLETERLMLRPFREDDLDDFAKMCADPEVMRYISLDGNPFNRIQTWIAIAGMLGHWQLRGYGMWAVEERKAGHLMGRIGFMNPEGWPGFELQWMLGRPFWGQGFATEGAKAALEYAFLELRQNHVISMIHPKNTRSIRLAERLGESLEGETKLFDLRLLVYGIHRDMWKAT
jgi:RimJ/RimL family protein N-acetyltransferase